jgi:uncharacterized membrane protein
MIKTVDEYLALLKEELAGADAALMQDAVSDAEEYLRTELSQTGGDVSESDALSSIIDKFGSPEEVAAGYRQMEATASPAIGSEQAKRLALARFFGVFGDPRAWGALLYLLLALATGIVYFTWVVIGISLSLGLIVLIVGLPVLILFLLSVRAISFVEGRLVEALLGVRMPRRPRFFNQSGGWGQKIKSLFAQRTTWTAMAYDILQLPLGIVYFVVAATLIATAIYFIALPVSALVFNVPEPYVIIGDLRYQAADWATPLFIIGGVVIMTATMHMARFIARAHGDWAKIMLVSGNDRGPGVTASREKG